MRPGETEVALVLNGQPVSSCRVIPLTLRVGAATIRIDGIGEVGTHEEHRNRGYSRRVLTAALAFMTAGDAALAMLYGIPNFYPRLGYTPVGPEHTVSIPQRVPVPDLPAGWSVRLITPDLMPACQILYNRETARATGAAVRTPGVYPWTVLQQVAAGEGQDECRVLIDPLGEVAGYAWRLPDSWPVTMVGWEHRQSLVLGEVVARDAPAANALLTVCQRWVADEAEKRGQVLVSAVLGLPPESTMAAAAMRGAATFQQRYSGSGDFMARTVHTGRLLRQLSPELSVRLGAALSTFQGMLRLETEDGAAILRISPGEVAVLDDPEHLAADIPATHVVRLPQTTVARLALGAFQPRDLLALLQEPPQGVVHDTLEAMFPPRHPHIYYPDRF